MDLSSYSHFTIIALALGLIAKALASKYKACRKARRFERLQASGQHKKPHFVLLVDEYRSVTEEQVSLLRRKYKLAKLALYAPEDYGSFEESRNKFTKLIREASAEGAGIDSARGVGGGRPPEGKLTHENIVEGMRSNAGMFPSLVILCSDVFRFHMAFPPLLYFAEIVHRRSRFDEELLVDALIHYAACSIRNGK